MEMNQYLNMSSSDARCQSFFRKKGTGSAFLIGLELKSFEPFDLK